MTIEPMKLKRRSSKPPAAAGRTRLLELNCEAARRSCELPEEPMAGTAAKPKARPFKLRVEKLTPGEEKRRFIQAAREAGAGEDLDQFRATLKRIARAEAEAKS